MELKFFGKDWLTSGKTNSCGFLDTLINILIFAYHHGNLGTFAKFLFIFLIIVCLNLKLETGKMKFLNNKSRSRI